MAVDMLDFEGEELYFDEPLQTETRECIDRAAEWYGDQEAENRLLRAYFLEPEHPMVLVALYRYFYYQHRYQDALLVAERVLLRFAARLGLPSSWQDLEASSFAGETLASMSELRFYLLALKGAGYLDLRLEKFESAIERLKKVVEIDSKDRLGAGSLLEIAKDEIDRQSGIYRLRFK